MAFLEKGGGLVLVYVFLFSIPLFSKNLKSSVDRKNPLLGDKHYPVPFLETTKETKSPFWHLLDPRFEWLKVA